MQVEQTEDEDASMKSFRGNAATAGTGWETFIPTTGVTLMVSMCSPCNASALLHHAPQTNSRKRPRLQWLYMGVPVRGLAFTCGTSGC